MNASIKTPGYVLANLFIYLFCMNLTSACSFPPRGASAHVNGRVCMCVRACTWQSNEMLRYYALFIRPVGNDEVRAAEGQRKKGEEALGEDRHPGPCIAGRATALHHDLNSGRVNFAALSCRQPLTSDLLVSVSPRTCSCRLWNVFFGSRSIY